MHPDHSLWPWHGFGMFPFIFLLFCIVVAFLIGRKVGGNSADDNTNNYGKTSNEQNPIETLKARYAKGEIDQEEFERIKKSISE